jgi:hypothetical protein
VADEKTRANLSIVVAENYTDRMSEVVDRLRTAGLKVERVLGTTGMVTGSIESAKVESLSSIEGVQTVERAREFQLPPPESDLQ